MALWNAHGLWVAAQEGRLEEVEELVQAGQVGYAEDVARAMSPALAIAAMNDHVGVVAALLAANADTASPAAARALVACAMADSVGALRALLAAKVAVDVCDDCCELFPLHVACDFGHVSVAECLLHAGAHVNAPDHLRRTPLHVAIVADFGGFGAHGDGCTDCLRRLLSAKATIDAAAANTYAAVQFAAFHDNARAIEALSAAKADIDEPVRLDGAGGGTAIHVCAANGSASAARVLAALKADLERRNHSGQLALHSACTCDAAAVARVLLQFRADVATRDASGRPASFAAARTGSTKCLRLLLAAKAPVDELLDGFALVHVAAHNGKGRCLRVLAAANADVNCPCAAEGFVGQTPAHMAAGQGFSRALHALASLKADLDRRAASGLTPLLAAVNGQVSSSVRTLLDHGADPDLAGSDGVTPLRRAAADANVVVTSLLLCAKADAATHVAQHGPPLNLTPDAVSWFRLETDSATRLIRAAARGDRRPALFVNITDEERGGEEEDSQTDDDDDDDDGDDDEAQDMAHEYSRLVAHT